MLKKGLSVFLAIVMVFSVISGVLPELVTTAKAATNTGTETQSNNEDVFSALGFDTSELPAGYDPTTTDNPYGREKMTGDQVFEPLIATPGGTRLYGSGGGSDNAFSYSSILSYSTSGSAMPFMGNALIAGATGDFDGDGLAGEVAYIGVVPNYTADAEAAFKLCLYDGKTGTYSDAALSVGTGSPFFTCSAADVVSTVLGDLSMDGSQQRRMDVEWQNLLQITAGDWDGDGISEIAVYVPTNKNARVDIYKYQKTGTSNWLKAGCWAKAWSYAVSSEGYKVPNMVSLVSGDFNQDGVDDLGISYGRAVYSTLDYSADYFKYIQMYEGFGIYETSQARVLWGGKSGMLQSASALDLSSSNWSGGLIRVSLVAGDIDGDGNRDLLMAGDPASDFGSNYQRAIGLYSYSSDSGLVMTSSALINVVQGELQTTKDANGKETSTYVSRNGYDLINRSQPFMRCNAAVYTPDRTGYTYFYVDSNLVQYYSTQFTLSSELDDTNAADSAGLHAAKLSGWGNINDTECTAIPMGQYTERAYAYCEYGAVSGDVHGGGNQILLSSFMSSTEHYASGYTSNRAYSYLSSATSAGSASFSNTSAAVTLPDTDQDTIVVEYTGRHYLTYSTPKLLAVLAAAPYFSNVDDIENNEFAGNNSTSWSSNSGEGHSSIITVNFEAGLSTSFELTVGGNETELELSAGFTLTYQKETATTTTYSLEFATSGNEDAVAFYSIPTECYVYSLKVPDGNGGYTTTENVISRTFSPSKEVLSLDYYESIQGNYKELPQIRGNILTSTPGDPSSYPSSDSGYGVINEWQETAAGVSYGNGSITQSIDVSTEESKTYTFGANVEFKWGGGIHTWSSGVQSGNDVSLAGYFKINPAGGYSKVDISGATFSGTVANMPEELRDYGYYFNWKIFSYRMYFDDNGTVYDGLDPEKTGTKGYNCVPVVSYIVNDVSEPPKLPTDFQQDYDRTTSSANCLTWTYDSDVKNFTLYRYKDFPIGGGLQKIASFGPSDSSHYTLKTDSSGKTYKEYYYLDEGLAQYTEYKYAIQIERNNPVPPLSPPSAILTARTKSAYGNPIMTIIESDGTNDGSLQLYPDTTATMTVKVTGPAGELASSYYSTVLYQWQTLKNGVWTDMSGETYKTLTFSNPGVSSAGKYRCRINCETAGDTYIAISAYTGVVETVHAKRSTYMKGLTAKDVTGGIEFSATVINAMSAESSTVPSGSVVFTLQGADGAYYQCAAALDAKGGADVVIDSSLADGVYTVTAYYTGSYVFKPCQAETSYLSGMSAGYTIDAPSSLVYGNGGTLNFLSLTKSDGVTTAANSAADNTVIYKADVAEMTNISGATATTSGSTVVKGTSYRYTTSDGDVYFFTATWSGTTKIDGNIVHYMNGAAMWTMDAATYLTPTSLNGETVYKIADKLPAGGYYITMSAADGAASAYLIIQQRPISLALPTATSAASSTAAYADPTVGSLAVTSGSWASCDYTSGAFSLASTAVPVTYTNTAGAAISKADVLKNCGYYTMSRAADSKLLVNYVITYTDGSLSVLGATYSIKLGARPFSGYQVGTVYETSPGYAYTRAEITSAKDTGTGTTTYTAPVNEKYQNGVRTVFYAVPDSGYRIYDWYVNGVAQGSTSNTFVYIVEAQDARVEVQFAVAENTLVYGAVGDSDGGTVTCSPSVTSGSIVLSNTQLTFTANTKTGYHFKEWRYTVSGGSTVYYKDDAGKASSTFDFSMPVKSCALYAVFERDYYTLTLAGTGLTAYYTDKGIDATSAGETKWVTSSASIKGGTTVVVQPAAGYKLASDARFVSVGSQGTAAYTYDTSNNVTGGTYTLVLDQNTEVSCDTVQQSYDVTLKFALFSAVTTTQANQASIAFTAGGSTQTYGYTTNDTTIKGVAGASAVSAAGSCASYYKIIGWSSSLTSPVAAVLPGAASSEMKAQATELSNSGAVASGKYYFFTEANGSTYFFQSSVTGYAKWTALAKNATSTTAVPVTMISSGSTCSIPALGSSATLTLYIAELPAHTVTLTKLTEGSVSCGALPAGASTASDTSGNTVVTLHEGDGLTLTAAAPAGKAITYWYVKDGDGTEHMYRATSLTYAMTGIAQNYTVAPKFAGSTYNTVTWASISEDQNGVTLVPSDGYLSTVAAGGSFSFTLTGNSSAMAMIDRVYANGNEFISAGNTVDGITYKYADSNAGQTDNVRTYTISNITADQVVTLTTHAVGVTVNGVDVGTMSGSGWTYNTSSQTLTVSEGGKTVSGANSADYAPGFRIVLGSGAGAVTFSSLTLTSATNENLIESTRTSGVTVTLSGVNRFTQTVTDGAPAMLKTAAGLTIRGAGSLDMALTYPNGRYANIYGIDAAGAFVMTGTAAVTVDVEQSLSGQENGRGVSCASLTLGASGSSASPSLKIICAEATDHLTTTRTYIGRGVYTTGGSVTVYGGSLSVNAYDGVYIDAPAASAAFNCYGGAVEIAADQYGETITFQNGIRYSWNVDYSGSGTGFSVVCGTSSASASTFNFSKAEKLNFSNYLGAQIKSWFEENKGTIISPIEQHYLRIVPLASADGAVLTVEDVTVTASGKLQSTAGNTNTYYYYADGSELKSAVEGSTDTTTTYYAVQDGSGNLTLTSGTIGFQSETTMDVSAVTGYYKTVPIQYGTAEITKGDAFARGKAYYAQVTGMNPYGYPTGTYQMYVSFTAPHSGKVTDISYTTTEADVFHSEVRDYTQLTEEPAGVFVTAGTSYYWTQTDGNGESTYCSFTPTVSGLAYYVSYVSAAHLNGYICVCSAAIKVQYQGLVAGSGGCIYTLSGTDAGLATDTGTATKLTLSGFSAGRLNVKSGCTLDLSGSNYLTASASGAGVLTFEKNSGTIDVTSDDGTGSLQVSNAFGAQYASEKDNSEDITQGTEPYGIAISGTDTALKLTNVRSLTSSAASGAFSKTQLQISYFDALHLNSSGAGAYCLYGLGWLADVGYTSSGASTIKATEAMRSASLTSGWGRYTSIYASSADASAAGVLTCPAGGVASTTVYEPATGGQNHSLTGASIYQGDTLKKTLAVADYTWTLNKAADASTDIASGALALTTSATDALEAGSYTLRATFYDENAKDDVTYTLDIPLTVTSTEQSGVVLTAATATNSVSSSGTVTLPAARGASVSLTAAPTGTTPAAYAWNVTGGAASGGTVFAGSPAGSAATLTVGSAETIGATLTVTVKTYSDTEKKKLLGTASLTISVVPTAASITISCLTALPAGDGSYYIDQTSGGAWVFYADVTLDNGTTVKSPITWSLLYAAKQGTKVASVESVESGAAVTEGILSAAANETGHNGALLLTAAYTNGDGTALKKTVTVRLSTDAYVSWTADGKNGKISSVTYGTPSTAIPASGAHIGANSAVAATAAPDDGYIVSHWYVNGVSVSGNDRYTVSADGKTLTFTAAVLGSYAITADYVAKDSYAVTFSAGSHGSAAAAKDGAAIASGDRVVKGSSVTFTASPDAHYQVKCWYVDGAIRTEEGSTNWYKGNTLTLSGIDANVSVSVEFEGIPVTVTCTVTGSGSAAFFVNGTLTAAAQASTGTYSISASSMDDVTVLASPASGYMVKGWSVGGTAVADSAEKASYTAEDITADLAVSLEFTATPTYTVTISAGSLDAGGGAVTDGLASASGTSTGTITAGRHEDVTLTAAPDAGSTIYAWYVDGSLQSETGLTFTLSDVRADTSVQAVFRKLSYDVTLVGADNGSISAAYLGDANYLGTMSEGETKAVRSGTLIAIQIAPDNGYGIASLKVNGVPVSWTSATGVALSNYSIPSLSGPATVEAVFAKADLTVKAKDEFSVADPNDPTKTVVTGTSTLAQATALTEHVQTADVVAGSTVNLGFKPATNYTVDVAKLRTEIQKVLTAVSQTSGAAAPGTLRRTFLDAPNSYRIYLEDDGTYTVEIGNVTRALDFTTMASPFVEGGATYAVTFSAAGSGTISASIGTGDSLVYLRSGALVPADTEVTFTMTPGEHNALTALTNKTGEAEAADVLASVADGTYTAKVTAATTVTAAFSVSEYKVTIGTSGTGSGTLTVTGTKDGAATPLTSTGYLPAGSTITVSAAAGSGSSLTGIFAGSTKIPDPGAYSVDLTSDMSFTAAFSAVTVPITYAQPANGSLKVTDTAGSVVASGTSVPVGTTLIIYATPNAHYVLGSLTASGSAVSNGAAYTASATRTNVIAASFTLAEVQVSWTATGGTVSVLDAGGSAVANGGYVPVNSMITVAATAAGSDYTLSSFTVSGAAKSASNEKQYAVGTSNVVITAAFKSSGGNVTIINNGGDTSNATYTVTIDAGQYGKLTVTDAGGTVKDGDTVKIKDNLNIIATAEDGYALASLTVNDVPFTSGGTYEVYANTTIKAVFRKSVGLPYYLDAGGNKVFIGFAFDADGSGKYAAGEYIAPDGKEVLFSENAKSFTDTDTNWAKEYINFVTERELFLGTSDTEFSPDLSMTRGMFATVLGRLYERSYGEIVASPNHAFDDCDYTVYYGKYVDWAAANGVITGYGGRKFGPDDKITREQAAAMIQRFASFLGVLPENLTGTPDYPDAGLIAEYAQKAALFCQNAGIITGTDAGVFDPRANVTRAQVSAIVTRLIKYVIKQK